MYFKQFSLNKLENFFLNDFEEENFFKVLFFLIFSFGFYAMFWFYNINRKLEIIDDDAPDARRAFYILFLFPVGWALIYLVLTRVIFSFNVIMFWMNIIISSIIIYLSLQYFYEFCESFGKLTRTPGFLWYILNYSGYFGVILIFFNIYSFIGLVLFPIFTISIMQQILNLTCRVTLEEAQKENFKNQERLA